MSDSLIPSFLVSNVCKLHTKNERCEQIAQVARRKGAMWANRSGRSPKMSEWANRSFFWANRSWANFFAKNEQFAQKRDEQIPSPANTVPCSTYVIVAFTADFKDQQHATSFLRLCTLQGSPVRQRSTWLRHRRTSNYLNQYFFLIDIIILSLWTLSAGLLFPSAGASESTVLLSCKVIYVFLKIISWKYSVDPWIIYLQELKFPRFSFLKM